MEKPKKKLVLKCSKKEEIVLPVEEKIEKKIEKPVFYFDKESKDNYKVFEQFINCSPNSEVKEIFENMSSGILPKYIKYDGKNLQYSRGLKKVFFSIDCDNEIINPLRVAEGIIDFLDKTLKININKNYKTTFLYKTVENWKDIKSNNQKEYYIIEFAKRVCDVYEIKNEKDILKVCKNLLFLYYTIINQKDIIIKDNNEIFINNIDFNKKIMKFVILSEKKIKTQSKKKDKEPDTVIDKKWCKHLVRSPDCKLKNKKEVSGFDILESTMDISMDNTETCCNLDSESCSDYS